MKVSLWVCAYVPSPLSRLLANLNSFPKLCLVLYHRRITSFLHHNYNMALAPNCEEEVTQHKALQTYEIFKNPQLSYGSLLHNVK